MISRQTESIATKMLIALHDTVESNNQTLTKLHDYLNQIQKSDLVASHPDYFHLSFNELDSFMEIVDTINDIQLKIAAMVTKMSEVRQETTKHNNEELN